MCRDETHRVLPLGSSRSLVCVAHDRSASNTELPARESQCAVRISAPNLYRRAVSCAPHAAHLSLTTLRRRLVQPLRRAFGRVQCSAVWRAGERPSGTSPHFADESVSVNSCASGHRLTSVHHSCSYALGRTVAVLGNRINGSSIMNTYFLSFIGGQRAQSGVEVKF